MIARFIGAHRHKGQT